MSVLKADVDSLREAAAILENILPQMDEFVNELNSIASEIDATWDGNASNEFVRRLAGQLLPMQRAKTALVGFKDYARSTANQVELLDRIIDSLANLLLDAATTVTPFGLLSGGGRF